MSKKILYSAIQASGRMTIGNYIGAIRNWVSMQENYDSYFGIADLHSLTVRQEPADFRAKAMSILAQYLAMGLDPGNCVLYFQSHVAAHSELAWILDCFTYVGELRRMTQYKDKSAKHGDNINAGLLTYPVLMAADILLYKTDLVPIGADQKQHLEIARDIAIRFNNLYGETFTVPEAFTSPEGAKICSLQDPLSKMSKSDENPEASVYLLDPPDVIRRKFRRAVTDCGTGVHASPDKPGITNLMAIYSAFSGMRFPEIEKEFEGKGYGAFKTAVADVVTDRLAPFQKEYERIINDRAYLEEVAAGGAMKASMRAEKTLAEVREKVGLTPKRL